MPDVWFLDDRERSAKLVSQCGKGAKLWGCPLKS